MQPANVDPPAPPPPLTVVVHHLPAVVVDVGGELDAFTAPRLLATLQAALRAGPRVLIVDLSAVQFMGSAGISVLLEASQRAGPHTALRPDALAAAEPSAQPT